MIGLVGHSGSGKSTLVNLICRFYDVSEGQVIDVDVRSVPVAEFRQHIGLVLQEPFLFFGTIAENIAYGKPTRRARKSSPPPAPPTPTSSSCACRTATIRWSANAARACPAASASASPSPAPC
jgi:ATP-binding cassette subfamily B protein